MSCLALCLLLGLGPALAPKPPLLCRERSAPAQGTLLPVPEAPDPQEPREPPESERRLSLYRQLQISIEWESRRQWGVGPAAVLEARPTMGGMPYQGLPPRALVGASFYEQLGRPDLVVAYRRRRAARIGLAVSWPVAAAVGVALGVTAFALPVPEGGCPMGTTSPACMQDGKTRGGLIGGGMGLLVLGFAAYYAWRLVEPEPLTLTQAEEEAARHNERLRQELELAPEAVR